MNHRVLSRVFTILILLFGVAFLAFAQEATIVGTITDPTGASIPGANITITNTETGQVTRITSNAAGEYVAPSLAIGHYVIAVEAQGFKSAQRKDLVLQVGDRLRAD